MSQLTSEQESARMERILSSPFLGIAYKDGPLHVQEIEHDPAFRDMLEEYLRERIRQRALSEQRLTNPCPVFVD